ARAGAEVVHVDASRKAMALARENALLSGLGEAPIRWIVEDARKFVAREIRRGRRYDAILLDPPKFGRGPDGEVWELHRDLPGLLSGCVQLLDGNSRFLVATSYAVRLSALALGQALSAVAAGLGGGVTAGEMGLVEEARGLTLPTAIFARWTP
ncbi:MAG: class I SAM-dependent rRNA methyltransferase, partial [Sphingomonadaceae bacterium]